VRRALRATVGLFVLTALFAGVPLGLLVVGRLVFGPESFTAIGHHPSQLWTEFVGRGSGQLFLALLVGIGLLAWAGFALSVLLEAAALVGKFHPPSIRGLGWAQGGAAVLLGLIVLSAPATHVTASAATRPGPAVPVSTQLTSLHTDHRSDIDPTNTAMSASRANSPIRSNGQGPSSAAPRTPVAVGALITTVRGDSLWRLAQVHLGDGMRWKEIVTLNADRVQPGGGRISGENPTLPVGWVLQLPADATDVPIPSTAHPGMNQVQVAPGDTLSGLAAAYAGDARRAGELAAATAPLTQPGGAHLTDPDVIDVGWTVEIPTAQPAPAPPPTAPAPAPPPPPPVSPAPAPPATSATQTTPTPTMPAPAGPTSISKTHANPAWTTLDSFTAVGALLAAGVLTALGARRVMQQRRRRPGQRIAAQERCSDLELAMRTTEDPPTVALLDAALRTWAARSAGGEVPDVMGALIGTTITLLLAEPAAPSSPFVPGPPSTRWVLDRADTVEHDPDVVAPFPTLVTLGRTPAGEILLIDLERAGALTLAGERENVVDVLSAMAVELAVSGWADHLDVTTVGFSSELVTSLGGGRLRHAATFDDVLTRLERRHREVLDALTDDDAQSTVEARVRGIAEQAWTPEVVLTADPVTADQQDRLALVAATGATTNLAAVITAADDAVDALPGPWVVQVPASGPTPVPVLDTTVELQRLSKSDRDALIAEFLDTDSDDQVPGPDADAIPPEPDDVSSPADSAAENTAQDIVEPSEDERAELASVLYLDPSAPEVQVLGTIRIVEVRPWSGKGASKVLELAVFMACNPGRGIDEVARALGGESTPWANNTRNQRLSALRSWLGADSNGSDYVPPVSRASGHRLAPTVRTDWQRFQTLVARGLHHGPEGLFWLEAALDLIRGIPFSGAPVGCYDWAIVERQEMINRIADVAHAAAIGYLPHDPRKARDAALRGQRADPTNEILYRDLFRAEYAAGNLPGIRTAAQRLRRVLAVHVEEDMAPETVELLEQLLDPRHRAARRAVP